MKTIQTVFLAAAITLATAVPSVAEVPDGASILKQIDANTNFKNLDLSASVTVVLHKPGEDDSVIQSKYYRRDAHDQFVILILKPDSQKGQGYLKLGDNITFYDPTSRQFSTLSGSENFQGSNAKNSDFQNSTFANDYDVEQASQEKLVNKDTWVLTLKAKRNTVTYPVRKVWVETTTSLVLKSEDYSLSGRLLRTSLYGKYLEVNGHYIPQLMRFEDNLKKGQSTLLTLQDPSLSTLPDTMFSKPYLEKVAQ